MRIKEDVLKTSCENCNYRQVGCHSKCESYAEYRKEIDKINKNRKKFDEAMGITLASYRRSFI